MIHTTGHWIVRYVFTADDNRCHESCESHDHLCATGTNYKKVTSLCVDFPCSSWAHNCISFTGCIYLGHPSCCEVIIFIFLWNCNFFYMCNVNYSTLLLWISFYISMYWLVSCKRERYYTVWMCLEVLLHFSFHWGSLVSCICVERNTFFGNVVYRKRRRN